MITARLAISEGRGATNTKKKATLWSGPFFIVTNQRCFVLTTSTVCKFPVGIGRCDLLYIEILPEKK
jgi:hypothetical protein